MKRITIFAISILLASTIIVGTVSTKSSAMLSPEVYEKQRAEANAHVIGKIISYEIEDREDETKFYTGTIRYNVEVTETIKGGVKPGAVITLSKSCLIFIGSDSDSEPELQNTEDGADCLSTPISVGESQEIYMNEIFELDQVVCVQGPCPPIKKQTYVQALRFGPKVEHIDFTNADEDYVDQSTQYMIIAAVIGIIVIGVTIPIILAFRKNTKLNKKR